MPPNEPLGMTPGKEAEIWTKWKKAYEQEYKRANRLEQELEALRNKGIGA